MTPMEKLFARGPRLAHATMTLMIEKSTSEILPGHTVAVSPHLMLGTVVPADKGVVLSTQTHEDGTRSITYQSGDGTSKLIPVERAKRIVGITKIVDAVGHEHAADGKFGSGGAKATESDSASEDDDEEEGYHFEEKAPRDEPPPQFKNYRHAKMWAEKNVCTVATFDGSDMDDIHPGIDCKGVKPSLATVQAVVNTIHKQLGQKGMPETLRTLSFGVVHQDGEPVESEGTTFMAPGWTDMVLSPEKIEIEPGALRQLSKAGNSVVTRFAMSPSDYVRNVVTHEMGHVLNFAYNQAKFDDVKQQPQALQDEFKRFSGAKDDLGDYARQDVNEYFAEAYLATILGKGDVHPDMTKIVKSVMRNQNVKPPVTKADTPVTLICEQFQKGYVDVREGKPKIDTVEKALTIGEIFKVKDASGHDHAPDGKFVGKGGITTTAKRLRAHEDGHFTGGKKCGRESCNDRRTFTLEHHQDGHLFRSARCDYHAQSESHYNVRHGHMDPKNMTENFGASETPKTIDQEKAVSVTEKSFTLTDDLKKAIGRRPQLSLGEILAREHGTPKKRVVKYATPRDMPLSKPKGTKSERLATRLSKK